MYTLKKARKLLAIVTSSALSLGIIGSYPLFTENGDYADAAKTIAEIQEQRKNNEEKIAKLEEQIDGLKGNKEQEEQQQAYLTEQISIIQENIDLLNNELQSLENDIKTTEDNIAQLDADIETQQKNIDKNIENFKQRLRTLYMTSNENSAAIILGSSSFYDMMARVEMVNRVAKYDDELINTILSEIDSLEKSKSDLEAEKLSLEMKHNEQTKRKEEKDEEISNLNVKMKDTKDEIERIKLEQAELERDKKEIEEENQALQKEEDAINEEIRRKAAEAQRLWEAQQAMLQQQQATQNAQNSQNSQTNNSTVPSYVTVTPSESGFAWPAPGFSYISSPMGYRWGTSHNGIDIGDAGIMGGAAVAAQSGTVIVVNNTCTHNYAKSYSCGCGGGYGNYVVISHDGTYSTLYGHLTSAWVSVGDYVQQGQTIGTIGSTGHSTGAHLHFEIRVNGVPQNPLNYVSP